MPKILSAKPGTQNNVPRRDNILTFTAPEGEPVRLLDFLFTCLPQARRTTVKKPSSISTTARSTTRWPPATR